MQKILGIELGSTRIKSVLIDGNGEVLASGAYEWENKLVDGYWSYDLAEVVAGMRSSYGELAKNYGEPIESLDAIGVSAMMHGYLAFDADGNLSVPFRTWRNTNTTESAEELTELFGYNIPERWSVAHYYQAVRNGEAHVGSVARITTLAGYVHYLLTGKNVLGIGDASGMFPIKDRAYNAEYLQKFDALLASHGIKKSFSALLPEILIAGEDAGNLTEEGARLLDETGTLRAGIPCCPPEGDAGTGMVATESVRPHTANVSAGTSAFLMAVLEEDLPCLHREIDVVTTPTGEPVAMVHVNNCTNEINAWTELFSEVATLVSGNISRQELTRKLFNKSLESDADVGGITAYNYLSGEPITGAQGGYLAIMRGAQSKLTLSNFMQAEIYSALCALSIGTDILYSEGVTIENVSAHGGFFKTENVGAIAMSAAVNAPVTVRATSGEGGAYGIALLALYRITGGESLSEFLGRIFGGCKKVTIVANQEQKDKFTAFKTRYIASLPVTTAQNRG